VTNFGLIIWKQHKLLWNACLYNYNSGNIWSSVSAHFSFMFIQQINWQIILCINMIAVCQWVIGWLTGEDARDDGPKLHRSVILSTLLSLSTSIQSGTLSGHLPSPPDVPKKTQRSSPPWRLQTSRSSPSGFYYKRINIPKGHRHSTFRERTLSINITICNKDRSQN